MTLTIEGGRSVGFNPTRKAVRQETNTVKASETNNDSFVQSLRENRDTTQVRFGGNKFQVKTSEMKELQKRGVLVPGGLGLMGNQILQNLYQSGFKPVVMDMNAPMGEQAKEKIVTGLAQALEKKVMKPAAYDALLKNTDITPVAIDGEKLSNGKYKPGDIPNVGMVVEAIFENLDAKKKLFQRSEELFPSDTILASNTSSLSIEEMAKGLKHPERVIGLHYFQPAITNRLAEVIKIKSTNEATLRKTMDFARTTGKVPIVINHDSPGAAANRILFAVNVEALKLYEEGWGTPAEIDELANQALWPDYNKISIAKHRLLPPFKFFKHFEKIGYQIAGNVKELGKFYEVPAYFEKENDRFLGKQKELRTAQNELAAFEDKYRKVLDSWLDDEGKVSLANENVAKDKHEIDQIMAKHSELKAKIATVQKDAGLMSQGLPEFPIKDLPAEKRHQMISDRLLGSLFGSSMEVVAEGMCEPKDVDTACRIGFDYNIAPFELMKRLGDAKVKQIMEVMKERYSDEFPKVRTWSPEVNLEASTRRLENLKNNNFQLNWLDTKLSPDGTMTMTLDRVASFMGKKNFNVLGTPTLHALKSAIESADNNPNVKAIVLQGNGGKIFSAGADLEEIGGGTPESMKAYVELGKKVMETVANAKKPVIAKINGDAYGGGVELALAADRIVMTKDAKLTLPEVGIGIYPAWGGTERLPEKAGRPFAKAVILNGKQYLGITKGMLPDVLKIINKTLNWDIDDSKRPGFQIDAKTAQAVGLADVVLGREELDEAVEQLVKDPEFLKKPDKQRGLATFKTAGDYPEAIVKQFRLDTIEAEAKKGAGRFSRDAVAIANRLIDNAGTPNAGKVSDKELKTIYANAMAKNKKIMSLVDMGLAWLEGKPTVSINHLAKAVLSDRNGVKALPTIATLKIGAKVMEADQKK